MEFLGHRKAYRDVSYFSGYGVIHVRVLGVSPEIRVVVKGFGETFKSMKLSFLVPVKTTEAERRQHFCGWSSRATALTEAVSGVGGGVW